MSPGGALNRKPLTDVRWALVRRFVLTDPRRGGRPPVDPRRRVDVILRVPRTASPWRSAYSAFRRWTRRGVWQRLLATLAGERDCSAYRIDSTIVRAHQHAAGAKKRTGAGKRSAARAAASPPRCTPSPTARVGRWT